MPRKTSSTLTNPTATTPTTLQQTDANARAKLAARFAQTPVQPSVEADLGSFGKLDIAGLLGSNDHFTADCQIPELSASEANSQLLKLQRQENAIGVALAKVRLQQNVVGLGIESRKFQGLEFDYKAEAAVTQTKAIGLERSQVRLQLETSKLTQDREYLSHQQITTEGTQNLTALVREEWALKLEHFATKNNRLRIDIQTAQLDNQHRLAACEAKLALVSGF